MGVIRDADLFKLMVSKAKDIIALSHEQMQQVLYKAIAHKADIVAIDEKETGLRATLNFGHTIGHAIEALVSPGLLHGECVAIGCVFEAYGLPVVMPKLPEGKGLPELMAKMAVDKKNAGGKIRCTIVTDVGVSIDCPQPVDRDIIEAVLRDALDAA